MTHSLGKKEKKKAPQTARPRKKFGAGSLKKIKAGWLQVRPVLFFVLGFVVLSGLFYTIWLSDFFGNNIHPRILSANAWISGHILNLFGQQVRTAGDRIFSAVFSISIARGCDAIEAMALFSAALLAFPARWTPKLIGLATGILALFLLNIVRIVSLFLVGVYYPKAFEIMHIDVWQVIFLIIAVGLWIITIQQSMKVKHETAN